MKNLLDKSKEEFTEEDLIELETSKRIYEDLIAITIRMNN